MTETKSSIEKITKQDISVPDLSPGDTAIVLQRHERYQRDKDSESAGSIFEQDAEVAFESYKLFFGELFENDPSTKLLFVSSDTQYAGKGRRSMETAELAQKAAIEAMQGLDIEPRKAILNLNSEFTTKGGDGHPDVRPIKGLREPQIFDNSPEYMQFLNDKYGADENGAILSQAAFAAHEMDADKDAREQLGAEGVHDIVARTRASLAVLKRYSEYFHSSHPDTKLVVWAASHYDTISPLAKDVEGIGFEEYIPVDYGAGVVITIDKKGETLLNTEHHKVPIKLGKTALN